ncbi:21231_t:CDS:2 [Rhizophagus irregularis]|nr:21231_t:CDS:2 [Rhizophagus irregularis]
MISTKIKYIIIFIIYFSNFCYSKYVPSARYGTSCVLDKNNNIIYFIGGESGGTKNCLNDFFYLTLPDSNMQPIFEEITEPPKEYCWSSLSLAEGGKKIYIFGGTNETIIFSYDLYGSKQWSIPKIDGIAPEGRNQFQTVSDNENNYLYIFGGEKNNKFFKDMNILNTKYSSWNNMMILGAQKIINVPYWADYTAIMLSSGEIVYIGGRQSTSPNGLNVSFAKMNENTSGNVPDSRIGHSAVLNSNNEIIVYGGASSEDLVTLATPDLVILSIASKPYQWIIPKVENVPKSRSFHSAAIVGNFMITTFGYIAGTQNETNLISILDFSDTTNVRWTSYDMIQASQTDKEETGLKETFISQNLAVILGGTIGGVVVLSVIIVVTILLYKAWRSHSNMRGRHQLPSSQSS